MFEDEPDVAEPQTDSAYRYADGMTKATCHHCEESIVDMGDRWTHEETGKELCE